MEQYPAIQAAFLDPRAKKLMKRDRYELINGLSKHNNAIIISLKKIVHSCQDEENPCHDINKLLYN